VCETALAAARLRGFRRGEGMNAGNLLYAWLLAGHWDRMDEFGRDMLGQFGEGVADACFLHVRLATLAAYRGELARARALLAAPYWEHSEDVDDRGLYWATAATVEIADGQLAPGLERACATVDAGLDSLGAHHGSVRQAWPDAVHAAIAAGEHELATELVTRMAARPVGRVPPLLRAELPRAQGVLAAARGEHADVERSLTAAIDALETLGYPYRAARARTDFAAWLIDQGRMTDASPLLDDAIATFASLAAAPALVRARALAAGDGAGRPAVPCPFASTRPEARAEAENRSGLRQCAWPHRRELTRRPQQRRGPQRRASPGRRKDGAYVIGKDPRNRLTMRAEYADQVGTHLVHPFEGAAESVRPVAGEMHADILNLLGPLRSYLHHIEAAYLRARPGGGVVTIVEPDGTWSARRIPTHGRLTPCGN
jgi:hypothetical protein